MNRRISSIKEGWLKVILCLVVIFSFAGGLVTGCPCPEDKSGSITFALHSEEYDIAEDEEGLVVIQMQGFSPITSPGDPMLPHKVYNIAVPPDIVWSSLRLDIVSMETHVLDGTYDIKPAPPFIPLADGDEGELKEEWGEDKEIVNGKNMKVYGSNTSFPESNLESLPYSQLRKWKFTKVDFTPFQYNPVSKELILIQSATIKISYDRSGVLLEASLLSDEVMDDVAYQILFNYETAELWYRPEPGIEYQQQYDYVIITTDYIGDYGMLDLRAFKAHKEDQGHNVLIITEEEWNVPGAQAPDQRAERIREWLKNNYVSMGIKYVLLIGDPTPFESEPENGVMSIPMKMCWPHGWGSDPELNQAPTDYFYADLTGDWDANGDGYYGEVDDYWVNGGVDFVPEVYVGRIPMYDYYYPTSNLHEISRKIINYELDTDIGWRKSALLSMSHFCDHLGEDMKNDYLTPKGFSVWRQYQQGDGTIFHYDGIKWSEMTDIPTRNDLNGVWGNLSNNVFAVGDNGTILHYNGSNWSPMASGTTDPLNGVWGILSNDVFAVGDNGTILHYNGSNWTDMNIEYVPDPAGWNLYSVWGILSNDVFAVGRNGLMLHYDGTNDWKRMNVGIWWRHLYSVWGLLSNDVFAVGWNGACYQTSYSPEENLRGNVVVRDRWAANDYGIVCWAGHGSPELTRVGYGANCWDGLLFCSDYCSALDDDHPSFVYQGSCDNGWPEDSCNLQYSILKQGGIGAVAATRAAWWNGLKEIGYYYMKELASGIPAGAALYLAKSYLAPGTYLANIYVFNLYGDPSTNIGSFK